MLTRRLTALLLPLAAVLVGAPGTAHAAVTPTVSIKVSSSAAFIGDTITVSGSVTGKSQGATVRFQRYASGAWHSLLSGKVASGRTYSFKPTIKFPSNSFRVLVAANKNVNQKASPSVSVKGGDASKISDIRTVIRSQVNYERARRGIGKLSPSSPLDTVAQNWTQHMASTGDLMHNPNYAGQYPSDCNGAKAENIAAGHQPGKVVEGWMNSSGHRANILNPAFTHLGIGYAVNPNDPGRFYRYYTQNFCQKR